MIPVFADGDIEKYRNNKQIIEDTINQVIKDFGLFGMDILFPENMDVAYNTMFDQLETQIHDLLENNNSKLMSLLYQIDIPEKTIRKRTSQMPDRLFSEVITEMILERELKKVLTRRYFKEQGY